MHEEAERLLAGRHVVPAEAAVTQRCYCEAAVSGHVDRPGFAAGVDRPKRFSVEADLPHIRPRANHKGFFIGSDHAGRDRFPAIEIDPFAVDRGPRDIQQRR
jgi:hypothetical protein